MSKRPSVDGPAAAATATDVAIASRRSPPAAAAGWDGTALGLSGQHYMALPAPTSGSPSAVLLGRPLSMRTAVMLVWPRSLAIGRCTRMLCSQEWAR